MRPGRRGETSTLARVRGVRSGLKGNAMPSARTLALMAGIACSALGAVAARADDGWSQAVFLGPLLVGLGCWAELVLWSMFVDRRWGNKLAAAFPMRLVRDRVYVAAIFNTTLLGFVFIMLVYAFPLRLQVVNAKSPLVAGIMLLPLLGGSAVGSAVAGGVNGKANWMCETLVVASSVSNPRCSLSAAPFGTTTPPHTLIALPSMLLVFFPGHWDMLHEQLHKNTTDS